MQHGSENNSLARHAEVVLKLGKIEEACPLGLAPSATTTAMLALGDALALSVMKLRDFTAADFAVFHPAGQLGRKLIKVGEAMTFRRGENLPVALDLMASYVSDCTAGHVIFSPLYGSLNATGNLLAF